MDAEKVQAIFEDGVLKLHLSKHKTDKPKCIAMRGENRARCDRYGRGLRHFASPRVRHGFRAILGGKTLRLRASARLGKVTMPSLSSARAEGRDPNRLTRRRPRKGQVLGRVIIALH
jgi:hypothetical protein